MSVAPQIKQAIFNPPMNDKIKCSRSRRGSPMPTENLKVYQAREGAEGQQ